MSLRRSYYDPPPNVGDTVDLDLDARIFFGDGQIPVDSLYQVVAVDITNDWFVATKDVTHQYAGPGPWTADINSCCRLDPPLHINNPEGPYRYETLVDFATTSSPESSLPPIVDCPQEATCSFPIAAVNPSGEQVRFRMSTPAEAGDIYNSQQFVQPGPPYAPNAASVSSSGIFTWNTTGATLNVDLDTYYSTQVMMEAVSSDDTVLSKTPLDFFIRLGTGAPGNNPPIFNPPTPADGSTFTACTGQPFTIGVHAADLDASDVVTLTVVNAPEGSDFTPEPPAHSVNGVLTWTPTNTQEGQYVINVIATDNHGATAARSYTIIVGTTCSCNIEFADVPNPSTFYAYIRCLACRGIINGYADGTFRPNNNVTRGQLSKIVSNSAVFTETQNTQMFQDQPVGSVFYTFTARLASRGYINGYPCGGPGEPCVSPGNLPYFRTNSNATRGQISKIVSNAAEYTEPHTTQTFQDVAPGTTFYDFIERLASRSVMSGYLCGGSAEPCVSPDNRPYFRPNNNATRGQTSKIVSNTFFPNCQTPLNK